MEILSEDILKIRHICENWQERDLANLAEILKLPTNERSVKHIENKIKWLFHSKTRAQGKAAAKGIWAKVTGSDEDIEVENQFDTPTYERLISGLLEKLNISHSDSSLREQEEFLCDAVIAEALVNMSPEQRRRAFTEKVGLDEVTEKLDSNDNTLSHTAKGVTAFSLVNAAGFSLYTSSTMALSFASGMAGITLPFAVYTGMTSFISVIIGPPGWAAFGSFIAWKLTSADWDKLRLALLYIISVRSRDLETSSTIFFQDNS